MSLAAGTRIGSYEIVDALGAGGMGEVYRARDARLGREVAVKVLAPHLLSDPEHLARFEREARLLASLNHPNITTVFGVEEAGGVRLLVMELVPGRTLAERLESGPLPVAQSLDIARQMAEALDLAHERGLLHRDLKPANVKVTPDGRVKLLDFGLAKAVTKATDDVSQLATRPPDPTVAGVVIGTAPYMSPEQLRGDANDKRSDIWAFGCVLYELLTARKAFAGPTMADTFARIVGSAPDLDALPDTVPARLRLLIRRCLEKDPARRLRDIGDARAELEDLLAPALPPPTVAVLRPRRGWLPWTIAAVALLIAAALAVKVLQPTSSSSAVIRAQIVVAPGETVVSVAISPDALHVAYAARSGGGTKLYVRPVGAARAQALAGAEGAVMPFFSPDSRWIGFFAGGELKKIPRDGGTAVRIAHVPPVMRGASWSEDGAIVLSPSFAGGLSRVSAEGGSLTALTKPNLADGESNHAWPHVLPGGKGVLFTVWKGGSFDTARIAGLQTGSGSYRVLIEDGTRPRYLSSGHILFARGGSLLAVRFDIDRFAVIGAPFSIVDGVSMNAASGAADFDLASTGTLVHVPANRARERSLVWVDRHGKAAAVPHFEQIRRDFATPRLSPDGGRLALQILNDIWVFDLARGTMSRLTFAGVNQYPVWMADGARVVFSSSMAGEPYLFWTAADGSGNAEPLVPDQRDRVDFPGSYSAASRELAYADSEVGRARWDLMILPIGGPAPRRPQPFLNTAHDELMPAFSPGGKWLAYVSDESGRLEVYVVAYPDRARKWQVSSAGGSQPVWARSGRELFYRDGGRMMAVSIAGPNGSIGTPVELFNGPFLSDLLRPGYPGYDVSLDGTRFLMIQGPDASALPTHIELTLNWLHELGGR